jgi:hypothetical protein
VVALATCTALWCSVGRRGTVIPWILNDGTFYDLSNVLNHVYRMLVVSSSRSFVFVRFHRWMHAVHWPKIIRRDKDGADVV